MSYKSDDTFETLLMRKINQVTPKQPTGADWERFDGAYRLYKKNQRKRKVIIGIWVVVAVAAFSLTSMLRYTNNSVIQRNAHVAASQPSQQSYAIRPAEKSQEKSVSKSMMNENSHPSDKRLPSTSALLPLQESGIPLKTTTLLPKNRITELSNENNSGGVASNVVTFDYTREIQPKHIDVLNVPNQKVSSDVSLLSAMAFRSTAPSVETQNNTTNPQHSKQYISIAAVTQNTLKMDSRYPAPHLSTGVGLTAGKFIHNHWSINIGVNVLFTKQSYSENIQSQTIENHIERIDTSLKYNSFFGRVMMQFDTLTTQKITENNQQYSFTNNVAVYNLPIQIRYHIGGGKRSIYFHAGALGTLLHQTQTTRSKKQSADDMSATYQTYRLGVAPVLGIGVTQTVYKNLSLHLSSNYATYFNPSFGATNLWQLHTGITYQF